MQRVPVGQYQYDYHSNNHFPYTSMTYPQPYPQYASLPPRYIQTPIDYSTSDTNEADVPMYPYPQNGDIYQQAYEENSLLAILESENNNLKQHRNYLVGQIRKTMQRERKNKQHLYDYQDKVDSLQATIRRMKQAAQEIILKLQTPQPPSSFKELQEELIHKLKVDFELEPLSEPQELPSNKQIGQLTHKFEALLNQHNKSSSPRVRKECIQVAKQIRELGDVEGSFGKKKKIRNIHTQVSRQTSFVESLEHLSQEQVQENNFMEKEAFQSGNILQIHSYFSTGNITGDDLQSPKNQP